MMVPKLVKIGWRKYQVTQAEHKSNDQGQDVWGQIEYESNKIYVYEKLDSANKKVCLLHELLHGIGYMTGTKSLMKNEELVTLLSENLYQIIKDNPDLIQYLGSDDNAVG